MIFISMKKILIFFICFLITSCDTYFDLSKHQGAIVKYKNVDTLSGWIEIGLKEKRQSYLIYLPLEADSLFHLNDTIK